MPREISTLTEARAVLARMERLYVQVRAELASAQQTIEVLRCENSELERRLIEATRALAEGRRHFDVATPQTDPWSPPPEPGNARRGGTVEKLEAELSEAQEQMELLREALKIQSEASAAALEKLERQLDDLQRQAGEAARHDTLRAAFDPKSDLALELPPLDEGSEDRRITADDRTLIDARQLKTEELDDEIPTAFFDYAEKAEG